jgi:hypothetical protein
MSRRISQLFVAPVVAGLLLPPAASTAGDHVVSRADVTARLREAAAARDARLSELAVFLASPLGQRAARAVGADSTKLQARLAHLSDDEARDLALRARALRVDPAASGLSGLAITAIVVGGVLLIAAVTWALAEEYCGEDGSGCVI